MTLITLQGNEVLLVGSDVATGAECCCGGGACCVCGFGSSFDCVLTNESKTLISATLGGLGYINVSVGDGDAPGSTKWAGQCCAYDFEDCETITVFCDDGFGQTDLTFCRCTSTDGACTDGVTEQQCLDLGGTFHADINCAADPCNPLP